MEHSERLQTTYQLISEVLKAGNLDARATFYTAQSVQIPPDRPPIIGWEAIRVSLESELVGILFESKMTIIEIRTTGDFIDVRGGYQAQIRSTTDHAKKAVSGSFLDFWDSQSEPRSILYSCWSNHPL